MEILATNSSGLPVNVDIDAKAIKQILSALRKDGKADSRFDINLVEGKLAEGTLAEILGNSAIEIKRDFAASTTGNVAVEFMCGGKPSGISTTQADWWAFTLAGDYYNDEVIVLIKKKRLERLLYSKRIVRGGDNKKAEMYLVAVEELVKKLKGES